MAGRRLNRRQQRRVRDGQQRRRERAATRDVESHAELALGPEELGRVIANHGASVVVESAQGDILPCALRQNLGGALCGDRVVWQRMTTGTGVVSAIEARHALLKRLDYSGRPRGVAANIDCVVVVVAPQPALDPHLIDRYLAAIHISGARPVLALNKIDLLDAETRASRQQILTHYRNMNIEYFELCAHDGRGLDVLAKSLTEGCAVLVGQSGVGKSSLIRALLPEREVRVQALSAVTGFGMHTTTTSMLYRLPQGGELIDSPGVRSFEPVLPDAAVLQESFTDIAELATQCRFRDCQHDQEPDCAVLRAIEQGILPITRLVSLQQLRDELGRRRNYG